MELRFECGTVVLDNPPAGLDVGGLPSTLWDPSVRAFRAPAGAYGDLCAALDEAGIVFVDGVASRRRATARWKSPDLWPYEEAALDAWQIAGCRGIVAVPTMSGSARLAIAALAREQRPSLCLVPTRLLLERWCRELQEFYLDRVGCYGNGVKRLRSVTVSTYASAATYMDRFGDRFDLLIADEVHTVSGGDHAGAFDMCSATARLGLTSALPEQPDAIERLSELVGPVVCQ